MKREVNVFLSVVLLLVIAVSALYFTGIRFTGYATFDQQNQTVFDLGTYSNTEYNGSAVVLSSGQTSGTYTSEIFNATEISSWNSLVWQGGLVGNYDVFLSSAIFDGNSVTEVLTEDGVFALVDMGNDKFSLNFSSALSDGDVLKIFAKKNKSVVVGVYDVSDNSGSVPLGVFTVTSDIGEWIDVPLSISTPTSQIWLGEGTGSGVALVEEFDYIYAEIQIESNISFQTRACSTIDCSDTSFSEVDLGSLNLIGDYFQYKVDFTTTDSTVSPSLENIIVDYIALSYVALSISQPSGTKTTKSDISLQFTATGSNLTCTYNLVDSSETYILQNITLSNCGGSTFSVDNDDSYVLTLYVINSYGGSDSKTSSFLVDTSSGNSDDGTTEEASEDEALDEEGVTTDKTLNEIIESVAITFDKPQDVNINPNNTQTIILSAKNSGTAPLSSCKLSLSGDSAGWVSYPTDTFVLNPNVQKDFALSLDVSGDVLEGKYPLSVLLQCDKTSKTVEFNINVIEEKLLFELLDSGKTLFGNNIRIDYSLTELIGVDQDVELQFTLNDLNGKVISELLENETISANSTKKFKAVIPINESLLPINKTTNETIETELELLVNFNSEVYSSSIKENILFNPSVTGFAIFGGGNGGVSLILVGSVLFALLSVFIILQLVRTRMSKKYQK